jgi:transcription antitermination factor NusG
MGDRVPRADQEAVAAWLQGRGATRCRPVQARRHDWATPAAPRGAIALPDLMALAGRRWYVAAIDPGNDYRVHREVVAAGFALAWLVECRIRRRDAKRGVMFTAPEPAFPGYLLVPLDLARDPWPAIEEVDGVERLLRRAGAESPAPIRGEAVARLRADIDIAGGVVIIEEGSRARWKELVEKTLKREEIFAKDQRLRIVAGPYTGFEGLYQEPRPEERIKMLLDTVESAPVVELPEAWVEPV